MKLGLTSALVVASLAAQAQANTYYWCSDVDCAIGKSTGPTYKCGNIFFDHYYESGNKKWKRNSEELDAVFWKEDGFWDCCHKDGKNGCYDIQST